MDFMWIAFGILAGLAALITVIASLPVYVIIQTDKSGSLQLRYRFLGKIFGEHPDPNSPITKALKKITGIRRLEPDQLKASAAESGLLATIEDSVILIGGLLRRVFGLLSFCIITVLNIHVVCARDDAAQTAIDCGKCYAVLSPLIGWLHGIVTVKPQGEQICVLPDYSGQNASYTLTLELRTRVFRAVAALLRATFDERRRVTASKNQT